MTPSHWRIALGSLVLAAGLLMVNSSAAAFAAPGSESTKNADGSSATSNPATSGAGVSPNTGDAGAARASKHVGSTDASVTTGTTGTTGRTRISGTTGTTQQQRSPTAAATTDSGDGNQTGTIAHRRTLAATANEAAPQADSASPGDAAPKPESSTPSGDPAPPSTPPTNEPAPTTDVAAPPTPTAEPPSPSSSGSDTAETAADQAAEQAAADPPVTTVNATQQSTSSDPPSTTTTVPDPEVVAPIPAPPAPTPVDVETVPPPPADPTPSLGTAVADAQPLSDDGSAHRRSSAAGAVAWSPLQILRFITGTSSPSWGLSTGADAAQNAPTATGEASAFGPSGALARASTTPMQAHVASTTAVPEQVQIFLHSYGQLIIAASLSAVAAAALPGLAGMLLPALAGVRIGYRQAKAGRAMRASGIARFADSGPIGAVRSGSVVALRRKAARVPRTSGGDQAQRVA